MAEKEETAEPVGIQPRRKTRRHRRVIRPGNETVTVVGQTRDDEADLGDPAEAVSPVSQDAVEQRYLADRPPHWQE